MPDAVLILSLLNGALFTMACAAFSGGLVYALAPAAVKAGLISLKESN